MDNPCKECPKMNPELFEPFEYACDNPCQEAKDFYNSVGNMIDDLLMRVKEMMGDDK